MSILGSHQKGRFERYPFINLLILWVVVQSALTGCGSRAATASVTSPDPTANHSKLTVLAAASLTGPFNEIGKLFEAQNPGVMVAFSYAGSQLLAQQISQGALADVFASASQSYIDTVSQAGRVIKDSSAVFAGNRLVVIYPLAAPARIKTLQDLAISGIKLDLAAKEVPAGQYSLAFLDKASKDPAFDPAFKTQVLQNVVSYEDNVKSVLAKVSLGEADAGIVYISDVSGDAAAKVGILDIPDALNVVARYPIAMIGDSQSPDLAKAFIALVLSPQGQQVLEKYHFITVARLPAP